MSTLIVEVTTIDEIQVHPNAERLEIAIVKGWNCIVGKGQFKAGDKCIYIPIDSVLTEELEQKFFSNSKVKLGSNHRIKTIKLRGSISQGLVIRPEDVGLENKKVGTDVCKDLGITKYEQPVDNSGGGKLGTMSSAPKGNPNFHKYTDIENFKNYNKVFVLGEPVSVTEKIHGTNFRCGWVKAEANTLWKRIKKLFGRFPEYEFVYGCHNRQLQDKLMYNGFYADNVYSEIVKKYDLKNVLMEGEVLYGEIYGDAIQKGYTYGCKTGEHKLVVFDIMIEDRYVDWRECRWYCELNKLPLVPLLYDGPFDIDVIRKFTIGDSVLEPTQKVREGVVIKPEMEQACHMGRKVLKLVSDEYLLKDNTDFH